MRASPLNSLFHFFLILALFSTAACSSHSIHSFSKDHDLVAHTSAHSEKRWTSEHPPSIQEITRAVKNDTANQQLAGMGEWWLYGPGIGHSILNIGTAVVFPPYALYLLGNAGLALAGKEPVRIIDILPERPREIVSHSIDGVCSVPGRINAAIARRPYVDKITFINKTSHPYSDPEN
jgi:hypothetical protein